MAVSNIYKPLYGAIAQAGAAVPSHAVGWGSRALAVRSMHAMQTACNKGPMYMRIEMHSAGCYYRPQIMYSARGRPSSRLAWHDKWGLKSVDKVACWNKKR